MKKKIKYLVKRIEKLEELAGLRKVVGNHVLTFNEPVQLSNEGSVKYHDDKKYSINDMLELIVFLQPKFMPDELEDARDIFFKFLDRHKKKRYITTDRHPYLKENVIFYYTSDDKNDEMLNKEGGIELYDWLLDVEEGYLKEYNEN